MITNHSVPLHWCCDARPCCGTVLYMEGPALNQMYKRPHRDNQDNAASDSLHYFHIESGHFFIC